MIFSGTSRGFECTECGHEVVDTSPTSLIPMLATVALAAAMWLPLVSMLEFLPWVELAGSLAAALLTFVMIFLAALRLTRPVQERCGECGGEMVRASSGSYNGWVPLPTEIVIYALTLALPPGVGLLLEFPAAVHFILSAAVLIAGTLFLQIADRQIQGDETVTIHFGMVVLVTVMGSALHLFWGWYGTVGTLAFILLWQLVFSALDR